MTAASSALPSPAAMPDKASGLSAGLLSAGNRLLPILPEGALRAAFPPLLPGSRHRLSAPPRLPRSPFLKTTHLLLPSGRAARLRRAFRNEAKKKSGVQAPPFF